MKPLAIDDDIEKVHIAIALFASCLKAGEGWSPTCEHVQQEAREALVRIADATMKDEESSDQAPDPLHRK